MPAALPPSDSDLSHLSVGQARRDAAVTWLFGRIDYERSTTVPYSERQLKLDRMRQLVTALGSPDRAMPIVHIAGTKGKGSTAAMLAAMLTAAGYRTGVFSSPHLEKIEERLAIDGQPVTGEQLADLVDQVGPVVEAFDQHSSEAGLTFFDIITALALVHFANQKCEVVVLEVGLGGRLDSTNVCLPAVSVITSISLDHTKQLGCTLASIAGEKAGIVKRGVPVVSGVTQAEPREVIAEVAREHGCRLLQLGRDFDMEYLGHHAFHYRPHEGSPLAEVALGLSGQHQAANATVALAVVDELNRQGWQIDTQAQRQGLARVQLPGRIERIPATADSTQLKRPAVVLDTAHNEASAHALAATLVEEFSGPRTLIVACSKDKDVEAIACALVPVFDLVIITRYLENPRAVALDDLAHQFQQACTRQRCETDLVTSPTPQSAWQQAIALTRPNGVICIAGSFYLAAELRPVVLG